MLINRGTTTRDVLREMGERLRSYRLQQNVSIRQVAVDAGLGIATVQRAEAGRGFTATTLVKLLRALGRLDTLEAFLPAPAISPIQVATLGGRERQKAGSPRVRRGRGQAGGKRQEKS